jgi:hypothetical protein
MRLYVFQEGPRSAGKAERTTRAEAPGSNSEQPASPGQYWFAPDVGQDAKIDATPSKRVYAQRAL